MEYVTEDVWHVSNATSLPAQETQDVQAVSNSGSKPEPKKQKVAIACDFCRAKKNKCDGVRPVCGRCLKRTGPNSRCTWVHGLARQNSQTSKDRIIKLTKRIVELEQGAKASSDLAPDLLSDVNPSRDRCPRCLPSNVCPHLQPCIDDQEDSTPEQLGRSTSCTSSQNFPPTPATSSPTSAMIGATAEDGHIPGFFGSSSAGNFNLQVRRAVDRRMGYPGWETDVGSPSGEQLKIAGSRKCPEPAGEPIDYALPPRRRADALMSVYWNAVHPLYPFLDKFATKTHYQRLWTGQQLPPDDTVFLRIINTIFALSSQLNVSVTPEQRKSSSSMFLQRAVEFLDLWKPGSVQTIQSFLLLAQYFQSTNEPHQCWMFVGYAVRTAQGLGLHLPDTSSRLPSSEARELVRRVWHGCVLMDRFLAMTYGRPTMVGRSMAAAVPLPLCADEDGSGLEPRSLGSATDSPSEIEFFVQSLKLYEIMHEILYSLYESTSERQGNLQSNFEGYFGLCTAPAGSLSIFDIDQRLTRWEKELPKKLQVSRDRLHDPVMGQPSELEMVFLRQGVVLRQRFLHVRLLSLRPTLSRFIASKIDDSHGLSSFGSVLSDRLAQQCSVVCVKVAQEAIDLVHSNRSTNWATTGLLAAWWYNVLFLYTAATVLIAAKLKDSIVCELGEESISKSWQTAISILEDYGSFSDSIPRLVTTLHVLSDEVPQQYSRNQQRLHCEQQDRSSASKPRTSNKQANNGNDQIPNPSWTFKESSGAWSNRAIQSQLSQLPEDMPVDFAGLLPDLDAMNFDPSDFSWLDVMPVGI